MSNSYVDAYVAGPVVCIYFKKFSGSSSWTTVGQIPTEYAPPSMIILCTHSSGAYVRVDSDGTLKTSNVSNYHTAAITYIIPL